METFFKGDKGKPWPPSMLAKSSPAFLYSLAWATSFNSPDSGSFIHSINAGQGLLWVLTCISDWRCKDE